MKKITPFLLVLMSIFTLSACFDDRDDVIIPATDLEVKDFVYQGMKLFYLYKSQEEVLADNYFSGSQERKAFLNTFSSPEDLFSSLLSSQDRFSIIMPNFHKLENLLNGISLNNGMAFGLVKISGTSTVFGYVRYVMPNTSAESKGVQRGMIFNRIDGVTLNTSNYSDLLQASSYSIGLATITNGALENRDQSITLTKNHYTENPILMHKTIDTLGHHIGYLMYNGFIRGFDQELNTVFSDFKAQGITELVIDLRYNGGGSIETSADLASMITGQFTHELFATEVFNENFEDQRLLFDNKIHTGASINNLNLSKVYILTSESTASASELLINGLTPYIDVVQIGTRTTGKFQGSITVYDSPDFTRSTVQPGHTYAMQPLVLKTVNADGFTDYVNGLAPDITQEEAFTHLGKLGQADEPLLHTAITHILGGNTTTSYHITPHFQTEQIGEDAMFQLNYQRMYSSFN